MSEFSLCLLPSPRQPAPVAAVVPLFLLAAQLEAELAFRVPRMNGSIAIIIYSTNMDLAVMS